MRIPSYLSSQAHSILLYKDHIEYLDNFSGANLTEDGWSLSFLHQKEANNPFFVTVLPSKKDSHLLIKVAKDVEVKMDLYCLLDPEKHELRLSVILAKGAKLTLTNLFLEEKTGEFSLTRTAQLLEDSSLDLSTGFVSDGIVHMNDSLSLEGRNSAITMSLLAISGEKDRFNVIQNVVHKSPFSTSSITNLLIAGKNAHMNIDVTGTIERGMEKSVCHQTNRGLLLADSGVISVEPKLMIDEFDVDAGHGCAIGQINSEELYYLQTRGLTEEEAKELIISGYLAPLYRRIGNDGLLKRLAKLVEKRMKGGAN